MGFLTNLIAPVVDAGIGALSSGGTRRALTEAGELFEEGARAGIDEFSDARDRANERFNTFVDSGQQANLRALGLATGDIDFELSDSQQRELERGFGAIDDRFRGNVLSGSRAKALTQFGADQFERNKQQAINTLLNISGQGLSAAGSETSADLNATGAIAGLESDIGRTNADVRLGRTSATNKFLGQIGRSGGNLLESGIGGGDRPDVTGTSDLSSSDFDRLRAAGVRVNG